MNSEPIVIVAAKRTPIGAFQGVLSGATAPDLGATAIAAAIADAGIDAGDIDQVLMTNAPYLLPKSRAGYRMGHHEVLDHMFYDGLQDPWEGQMMGHYAEETAKQYGFSREEQDAFAIESVTRAQAAVANGTFEDEIAPVTIKTRKGDAVVDTDETPGAVRVDKIPTLRPAFAEDGTVTAATSSSISDGAAPTLLMTASEAERRGIEPIAQLVGHSSFAHEPAWFTTAPVSAVRNLHAKLGWSPDNVDLYEINEAFAVVTMAAMKDVGIDHAKVNVNGGAFAMGHPIGATGARITTTLLHALKARGGKRGIASLCIGGGEAVAIGVELI